VGRWDFGGNGEVFYTPSLLPGGEFYTPSATPGEVTGLPSAKKLAAGMMLRRLVIFFIEAWTQITSQVLATKSSRDEGDTVCDEYNLSFPFLYKQVSITHQVAYKLLSVNWGKKPLPVPGSSYLSMPWVSTKVETVNYFKCICCLFRPTIATQKKTYAIKNEGITNGSSSSLKLNFSFGKHRRQLIETTILTPNCQKP